MYRFGIYVYKPSYVLQGLRKTELARDRKSQSRRRDERGIRGEVETISV